jgi:hypothetical protein
LPEEVREPAAPETETDPRLRELLGRLERLPKELRDHVVTILEGLLKAHGHVERNSRRE